MNDSTHELSLQRLVDGELPASDRVQLLEQAECDPAIYRLIAMAFVEHQVCTQAISDPPEATAFESTKTNLVSQPTGLPNGDPHRAVDSKSHSRTAMYRFMATAATIAIVAWAGGWMSANFRGDRPDIESDLVAQRDATATGAPSNENEQHNTLDQASASNSTLDIDGFPAALPFPQPLAPPAEFAQMDRLLNRIWGDPAVTERDRVALMRAGFRVQEIPTLRPVDLGDGHLIEVPVRQLEVQYIGSPLYQ